MNRRSFFVKSTQLGIAVALGLFPFIGCENKKRANENKTAKAIDPCEDLTGVAKEDIKIRESYKYVEHSQYPEKICKNCEFWSDPENGKPCGGCDLFDGPISIDGYCAAWSQA